MRHCKSSWQDIDQDDHGRVLNPRGVADAPKLGAWLIAQNHIPKSVLCSDAARAQETWHRVASAFDVPPPIALIPTLYLAPDVMMFEHLRRATTDVVAMVGHNPGIADLAQNLVTQPPDHPRFDDYPTGATAVITFAISQWSDLAEHSGQILDFITPRELS